MAEALAILAAVETCLTLTEKLYKWGCECKNFPGDVEEQVDTIGFHNIMFVRFKEFFKKHEEGLPADIKAVLKRTTVKLETALDDISRKLERHCNKDKLLNRLVWPVYKPQFISAVQSIVAWVGYLNMYSLLMPEDMKRDLSGLFASTDLKHHPDPASALKSFLEMQKLKQSANEKSKLQDFAALKKTDPRTTTVAQPGVSMPMLFERVDFVQVPPNLSAYGMDEHSFEIRIARLVDVLQEADPSKTHIPRTERYFAKKNSEGVTSAFGIAYATPNTPEDQPTLKKLIADTSGNLQHSLNDRIRIAVEIVSAVYYFHALSWVHEAVRSDNIILFYTERDLKAPYGGLGSVNLMGFGDARLASGRSFNKEDSDWKNEIYRHPDRQRDSLQDQVTSISGPIQKSDVAATSSDDASTSTKIFNHYFVPKYDVYSIGVVLLELGLWEDLSVHRADFVSAEPSQRKSKLLGMCDSLRVGVGMKYQNLVWQCLNVDETAIKPEVILEALSEISL